MRAIRANGMSSAEMQAIAQASEQAAAMLESLQERE